VLVSDCNALQHSDVGDEPLLLLPVIKLKQGVKLLIIEVVHGVLICPLTNIAEMTKRVADIAISLEPLIVSMSSWNKSICGERGLRIGFDLVNDEEVFYTYRV
jgi:hypothetical protein